MDTLEQIYEQWRSLQPLDARKQHLLRQRFEVDYHFHSNHIEGNTLTYGQTEVLLLFGRVSGEGSLKDFADMQASVVAQRMMEDEALSRQPLTQTFIRQLHRTLLREDYTVHSMLPSGVATSYTIHAGEYKTRPNSVVTLEGDHFDYAAPEETAALMGDLVDWYNATEASGQYGAAELAALFHYRYIRIHPFEDGNGRMARLLANYILLRFGWPMVVVRCRQKAAYLGALHDADVVVGGAPSLGAHASLAAAQPFVRFFRRLVAAELRYYIDFALEHAENVWWHDGERLTFRSPSAAALLRALSEKTDSTPAELAARVGLTLPAVKRQLQRMTEGGLIQRREQDGTWHVMAIPSV